MSKQHAILEGLDFSRNQVNNDIDEGTVKTVISFEQAIGDLNDKAIIAMVDALNAYEKKTHHIPSENDKVETTIMGNKSYIYYVNKSIKGRLTQCVHVESIIVDKNNSYLKTYVIYPTFPGIRIKPEADTYKGSTPEEIEKFIAEEKELLESIGELVRGMNRRGKK